MALVLTREVGEDLLIRTPAGDVWVGVAMVKGRHVRLAITAPNEWLILRRELLRREDVPPGGWDGQVGDDDPGPGEETAR